MEDSLMVAFWLLVVGMGSAFFALFLIGLITKSLIYWLNRFNESKNLATLTKAESNRQNASLKIAVIATVVDEITAGKGRIQNISKIDS